MTHKLLKCTLLIILFFSIAQKASAEPIIGVIIPLPEESGYFQQHFTDNQSTIIDGIHYQTGKIGGQSVVFVNSGLGIINAAMTATRLIHDFNPSLIILSGSSGNLNPRLKRGDVVIGSKVINVDLGNLTPQGVHFEYAGYLLNPHNKKNLPLVFTLDRTIQHALTHIEHHKELPSVILGTIASSDQLPNPLSQVKLMQKAKMDVIEMEGGPTMQACWLFQKACVVIRGVSNEVNEMATNDDIIFAGDNAAKITIDFIQQYPIQ
jgi:adenosylhomocysteine nucleosidase